MTSSSTKGAAGVYPKARRNLTLVTTTHRAVCIYDAWRAEIAAKDWDAIHVRGDKRQAVELSDTRKARWMDL